MDFKEYKIIRIKDLQSLLYVSETTAKSIFKDIKQHYEINTILFIHFKQYFKVDFVQNEIDIDDIINKKK